MHTNTHTHAFARAHAHTHTHHYKRIIIVISELLHVSRVVTGRLRWTTLSSHTHPELKRPFCEVSQCPSNPANEWHWWDRADVEKARACRWSNVSTTQTEAVWWVRYWQSSAGGFCIWVLDHRWERRWQPQQCDLYVRPTLSHKLSRQVGLFQVCVRLILHIRYR